MTFHRLGLAASVAIYAVGCAGSATPASVVVMDQEPGVDFVVADDALTFPAAGNQGLLARVAGDVLVFSRGHGLLRKVVSVTPNPGTGSIVVATEAATLADAVEDGSFDHHLTPHAGKLVAADGGWKGFSFGLGTVNVAGASDGAQIDVTGGHFDFDPSLDLHVGVSHHELTEVRAVASGVLDSTLDADVAVSGHLEHTFFKPLYTQDYPMVQVVGAVPVVEVVELTVGVGFDVSAQGSATVHLGGSAHGAISAGAIYERDGGWSAVGDHDLTFTSDSRVTSGELADLKITAMVYAELSVKFYDVVGPAIRIAPYVALERVDGQDGWAPSIGVLGRFEALLTLPFVSDKEWIPWKAVLFDVSTPFAPLFVGPTDAGDACNGVSAEGQCADGVVVRCDGGTLHLEDCAASGLGCALAGSAVACVSGCGDLDFQGGCVDASLRWCDAGQVYTVECPTTGAGCGWQDDAIGNNCL